MSPSVVLCLGRLGDILNALPIAHAIAQKGPTPFFLVSAEFSSILESVSYVNPVVWDGPYDKPSQAILWFRKHHGQNAIITAQSYCHPSDLRRLTPNYQQEAWRLAGCLEHYGTRPLVLDRRNYSRETELTIKYPKQKPKRILLALHGISSKYPQADLLRDLVVSHFSEYEVLDLRKVTASKPQDLLGLFDTSDLLITVDTMHLHLARASQIPVVAITNKGWLGSTPPPNTIQRFSYEDRDTMILSKTDQYLRYGTSSETPIMVVNVHGDSPRHLKARESWKTCGLVVNERIQGKTVRDARSVGDNRAIPFFKDLLIPDGLPMRAPQQIVVWTNDDVEIHPAFAEWVKKHVSTWGAVSMRRNEEGHIGRELFAFRVDWLREYWNQIPDFLIASPYFDLVIAALIRKTRGIRSTMQNLGQDFFPCETPHRYALHEPHPSGWAGAREFVYKSNIHNRQLALDWCKKNMPSLKL